MADSSHDLMKRINLLDAVYFTKKAWDQVTPKTVQNCFRKAGFTFNDEDNQTTFDGEFEPEDELPLNVLAEIQRRGFFGSSTLNSLNDFYQVDEDLVIERSALDQLDSLTETIAEMQEISDDSEECEPIDLQEIRSNISTYKEAMDKTRDLKAFVEYKGDIEAMNILSSLELHFQDVIVKTNTRQTTMNEYLLK